VPAPDSVTFNSETTENPKIQHKAKRSSIKKENQKSKNVAAGVKFRVWQ